MSEHRGTQLVLQVQVRSLLFKGAWEWSVGNIPDD